jgi:hypothetical protein
MRIILITLVSIFLAVSCTRQSKKFSNTKWEFDWGQENLKDFIKFDSVKYVQYSSEIGEYYYGTYEVKGDTIILNQERGEYDNEFPKGSRHIVGKVMSKLIFKNNNQLGFIQNWDDGKNKWKENYFFKKK